MQGFNISEISDLRIGSTKHSAIYIGERQLWARDYSTQFLTFELLEPSAFAIIENLDLSNNHIYYSTDDGATWTDIRQTSGKTPVFSAGTNIMWKGDLYTVDTSSTFPFRFTNKSDYVSVRGRYNLSGNPLSLYYGDAFTNFLETSYPYMYYQLFIGNDLLVSAKYIALTQHTLERSCYSSMFYGCSSLVEAPELPAMTLAPHCYSGMFGYCYSLTTAPVLPAIKLVTACYSRMFERCTSLNSITCLATDVSAYLCTDDWVKNVSATGTFIKDHSMSSWTTGTSGIPSGWTTTYDYANECLTFESTDPNGTSIRSANLTSSGNLLPFEASTDGGETWTSYPGTYGIMLFFNLSYGQKLYLRGTNESYALDETHGAYFEVYSGTANVYGNIMSMINKDKYRSLKQLYGSYNFCKFFRGNIVSVEHLILPAKILTYYCYDRMFGGCSSLTTAPALPATTLALDCYRAMFTSCSSLTTAPALPATTLAPDCYKGMFTSCTSLTTAPALPATTLQTSCYHMMFDGCTSLTTAPVLPATTLSMWCYGSMFRGCTSLSSVTCLATDISASYCTNDWLSGVSSTGTFTRDANMTDWTTGASGIPSGWTVVPPLTHDYSQDYLTIESLGNNNTVSWKQQGGTSKTIQWSTDMTTWTSAQSSTAGTTLTTLNNGDKLYIKGSNNQYSSSDYRYVYFQSTENVNVSGNIMSLIYGDNFINQSTLSNQRSFANLFHSFTTLISAENLILPATTLSNGCYSDMFSGCSSLTTAPELPATTLTQGCYSYMFYNCSSLNNVTCLATDISASDCTSGWVNNVAASGTFTKAASMTSWTTGSSGIPNGWTVQDAS